MIKSDESDDTLDRVIEGLRLADRFEIHVVACGDLEQVERAQAQLARALGDRAVSVDVAVTDLGSPEALITRLLEATTRGVLVLVATVMDDEFGQWSLVFQRLNEARNRLKERFDGLVLLLLAPLKPVFLHNAQDFFSWRSASIEVPGRVDAPHDDWASYDDRASYEEPEEPEESPVTTEARPAPPVLPSDAPLPSVAQPELPVARAITGRWEPLHDRVEDEADDEPEADEPDARPKGLGASESSLMTILPSLEEPVSADDVLSTDLDLDLGPSPELESASRVTSVPSVMLAAAKPATRPEAKSTPRPSKRPDLGPTPNHARKQAPEHPKAAPARTVAGSAAPPPLAPPAVEPAFDEVGKGVVPKPKAKPTPASKPSAATSSEPARPASAMVPNQSATPPTSQPP
ncbi:MAG: hypothetical protein KDK70_11435, partial [Myxococcales bacterium]|nr:hypothetical protein [Myxococcales bacterium]